MKVLGLDPGFASFGYALLELGAEDRVTWHRLGVLVTAPQREEFSAAADASRRTKDLWLALMRVAGVGVDLVAVEALAFPRGRVQHSVISGLGRARALVDVMTCELGVELVELVPQTVRRTLGVKEKGKAATRAKLEERWPHLADHWGALTRQEHTGDAAAVAIAALRKKGRDPR